MRKQPARPRHPNPLERVVRLQHAYEAAIKALHELGRACEAEGEERHATAARIDGDNLTVRMKLHLPRVAANDNGGTDATH